jgi:hypothetical protein
VSVSTKANLSLEKSRRTDCCVNTRGLFILSLTSATGLSRGSIALTRLLALRTRITTGVPLNR